MNKALWLCSMIFVLVGCGHEVGRVPFAKEDTSSAALDLSPGEVAFWTDLDIKYDGAADLKYKVELKQAGKTVASAVCDPLGQLTVSFGRVDVTIGTSRSLSVRGKMNCGAKLAKGGPTTIDATLEFVTRPTSATFTRADLVVRQ